MICTPPAHPHLPSSLVLQLCTPVCRAPHTLSRLLGLLHMLLPLFRMPFSALFSWLCVIWHLSVRWVIPSPGSLPKFPSLDLVPLLWPSLSLIQTSTFESSLIMGLHTYLSPQQIRKLLKDRFWMFLLSISSPSPMPGTYEMLKNILTECMLNEVTLDLISPPCCCFPRKGQKLLPVATAHKAIQWVLIKALYASSYL